MLSLLQEDGGEGPGYLKLRFTLLILVEGLTKTALAPELKKLLILAAGVLMIIFCVFMIIRDALTPQDPEE